MVLALVAVLAVPTAALAQIATRTGETAVTGNVGTYYTLTVPSSIPLGTLSTTSPVSNTGTITVETNGGTISSVTIKAEDKAADAPTYGKGYLRGSTNYLTPALLISVPGWWTSADLTTARTATALLGAGSVSKTLTVNQPALTGAKTIAGDAEVSYIPAGSDGLTILFTAEFN